MLDCSLARLWPILNPPKEKGRLVPLDKLPPGTREQVLNKTRAKKGLPPIKKK